MNYYGFPPYPGFSRDSLIYECQPSTVSALNVCFCCLSSKTPLISAITCTHTEFVQQQFTDWGNQQLAICFTCHFMLKKIETFRRQVRESLLVLSDYQHTNEENLNRPRLVNNLVTTDIIVTSNVIATEATKDNVEKNTGQETIKIVDSDDEPMPGPSNEGVEQDDQEIIEVTSDLLVPVSVVINGKRRPIRTKKHAKTHYTPKRQNIQSKKWFANRRKEEKAQSVKAPLTVTKKERPSTSFTTGRRNITNKNVEDSTKTQKKIENSPKPTKNVENSTKPTKNVENSTKLKKNVENSTKPKKNLENSTKTKKNYKKPFEIEKSTYKVVQQLETLCNQRRKQSFALKSYMQLSEVLFNMKTQVQQNLDKIYDGRIRVKYLTQAELMLERELERKKGYYVNKQYKCESCIRGFTAKSRYNLHTKKFHPVDRSDYEMNCDVCDIAMRTSKGIHRHVSLHIIRYVCVPCGNVTRNLQATQKHYKLKHALSVKCNICNKRFGTLKQKMAHKKRDHKRNCKFCPQSYIKYTDLLKHYRKKHAGEKPEKLSISSEAFQTAQQRYNHSKLHKADNRLPLNHINKLRVDKSEGKKRMANKEKGRINLKEQIFEGEGIENNEFYVIANSEQNIVELQNNEQNNVELENNEQNDVELENNEVVLNVDEQNIVNMNTDHNVVVLDTDDQNIVEIVNNEHNNIQMVNNQHNNIQMANNEHNNFEIVNNEHNNVVMVNNELRDFEEEIDQQIIVKYNNFEGNDEQNCIIGL